MDDSTLRRLEFPRILEQLAGQCSFAPSRELALRLKPSTRFQVVERRQQEVAEATRFLTSRADLPGSLPDVRQALYRAAKGGMLRGTELAAIAQFAQTQWRWARQIRQAGEYPVLRHLAADLANLDDLVRDIDRAITSDGEVRDQASPELERLRRQQAGLRQRIRQRLDGLVRNLGRQGVLQEMLVTQRNGRWVLPVKAEHRAQVPGLIHDRSATGMTLFIEPSVVIDANNDLRQVEAAIQQEIERILTDLTALVVKRLPQLEPALRAVTYLDFTFGRARLGLAMDAVIPELAPDPVVKLAGARHPLLGSQAVPVDVEIGDEFDMLIITGPNTGGKTVALKTLGLLVVMTQAGLPVPCGRARCGVFARVFADIGDEQSIEQNLSTFSSHLTNVMSVLPEAGPRTLVLLDELGAGTDPEEGAALALALLDYFRESGARTVVTTHFGQLKPYAYRHERVRNASVEFDPETLQPTYRLLMGVPGRSNALEIAARLGLSQDIIERARGYLSGSTIRVEDALAELERVRARLEQERAELQRLQAENKRLQEQLQQDWQRLEQSRRRFTERERVLARTRLNEIFQEADDLLADLRRAASKNLTGPEVDRIGTRTREKLRCLRSRLDDVFEPAEKAPSPASTAPGRQPLTLDQLQEGDRVLVATLGQEGIVLQLPQAGEDVLVQVGPLKIRVTPDQLRRVQATAPTPAGATGEADADHAHRGSTASGLARRKASEVDPQIHLRGLTVDEALWRLDKYLDDAFLAGLSQVTVIHGKGSGILRRAVHDMLRHDRRVASFRLGGPGEGDYGVTVVELSS